MYCCAGSQAPDTVFVVGITGGIGSGKSAVTDYLETLGVTIGRRR